MLRASRSMIDDVTSVVVVGVMYLDSEAWLGDAIVAFSLEL